MELETPPTPKGSLDRRKLLKRAGIVTAGVAAWSTPMVTSLASNAYAAGSAPAPCPCTFPRPICGNSPNSIDGNCYCYNSAEDANTCLCAINEFCNVLAPCTTQADCGAGFVCVNSDCGVPLCIATCDNPNAPKNAGKGAGAKAHEG